MKTKLLLVGVCLLTIFSCNESKDRKALSSLKELSVNYPDSALKLLDEDFNLDLLSIDNLAEWCLLKAIVTDSLKEEMNMDTLLFEKVIDYYDDNEKMPQRAQAWYYYGRVLDSNKKPNEATLAYLNAIEYAEEGKEYNLAGYSSSYLADIYRKSYNRTKAREFYNSSASYFEKANNTKSKLFAYRNIGATYFLEKDYENALSWIKQVDSLSVGFEDAELLGSIANQYANIYRGLKEYDLMESYIKKSISFLPKEMANYYLLIHSYKERKGYKKAKLYLDSLTKTPKNRYEEYLSSNVNYWLEKEFGNYEKALMYYEKSIESISNIRNETSQEEIIKIENKYNQARIIHQRNMLESQKERLVLTIIIGILILIIVGYLIYNKEKRKKERLKNELITKELELQTKELENKNQSLLIDKYKIVEDSLLQKSFIYQKLKLIADLPLINLDGGKEEEFQKRVQELYEEPHISETDWKMIRDLITNCYPTFMEHLKNAKITSEKEVNFCCLLRFGLPSETLLILLDLSKGNYKSKKGRICTKLGITNQDIKLEEYLKTL